MAPYDRPRTDPIATHAYTLPVVRELPVATGSPSASAGPHGVPQPADAHAW